MDLSFLMVFLKKYFVNPAKRQNFCDASGQIFSFILRPCLIAYGATSVSDGLFSVTHSLFIRMVTQPDCPQGSKDAVN